MTQVVIRTNIIKKIYLYVIDFVEGFLVIPLIYMKG